MNDSSKLVMLQTLLNTKLSKKVDCQLSLHGINFSEYMLMANLADAPKNTLRRIDLAESVGLSASGVTRLLAPMEKNNIVEKEVNPRDARVSLVKLTKTGKQLFADTSITFDHTAQSLTSNLTGPQTKKFLELVNLLF